MKKVIYIIIFIDIDQYISSYLSIHGD